MIRGTDLAPFLSVVYPCWVTLMLSTRSQPRGSPSAPVIWTNTSETGAFGGVHGGFRSVVPMVINALQMC